MKSKSVFVMRDGGSDRLSYRSRRQIVDGFEKMVEDHLTAGLRPHIVTFMFKQLPGKHQTKLDIMRREVSRVHAILTTRIVRKPTSVGWSHLRPVCLGCPDKQVRKNKGTADISVYRVNDGWHFHVVGLVPPPSPLPEGIEQLPFLHRQSRLKVSLKKHFTQQSEAYLGDNLERIHVRNGKDRTVRTLVEYVFKAFLNGDISYDDILAV